MNKYFKRAETLIAKTADKLIEKVDTSDGEDITCYGPYALDEPIRLLIEARSLLMVGRHKQRQEEKT